MNVSGGGASPFARMEINHWIPAADTQTYNIADAADLLFIYIWNATGDTNCYASGGWINEPYGLPHHAVQGWATVCTAIASNPMVRNTSNGFYIPEGPVITDISKGIKYKAGVDYVVLLGYGPLTE